MKDKTPSVNKEEKDTIRLKVLTGTLRTDNTREGHSKEGEVTLVLTLLLSFSDSTNIVTIPNRHSGGFRVELNIKGIKCDTGPPWKTLH